MGSSDAYFSGSAPAIKYVWEICPELKVSQARNGRNLLHLAARSGSVPAIQYVLAICPELKASQDRYGINLLHLAALSGSVPAIEYVLANHPTLAGRLWVKDNNGDTVDSHAIKSGMTPSPRKILTRLLKRATGSLLSGTASEKQCELIAAFQDDFKRLLLSDDEIALNSAGLSELQQETRLPMTCRRMLAGLAPILKLKDVKTNDTLLNFALLRQLLNQAGAVFHQQRGFFGRPPESMFLRILIAFGKQVKSKERDSGALSNEAMITLSVILDDYQRAPGQKDTKEVDSLLAEKLLATTQMQLMRPKATISEERDIQPQNFQEHFAKMRDTFKELPVSRETKRITTETILPGLEHLLENEVKVVEHVMTQFGVLYYLDEPQKKLPMHTDHTDHADEAAYRALLHRLLQNLFGAFYICQEAGVATKFFEHLTDGFCLEGRTRGLFTWAAKFSEIKSFDAFMAERIKEYCAYQGFLYDKPEDDYTKTKSACDFILKRFNNYPCKPHKQYAPDGEITREGLTAYIETVLSYDPSSSSCTIS